MRRQPTQKNHTYKVLGGGSILGMNANKVANELMKQEQKKIDGTVKKKPSTTKKRWCGL